MRRSPTRSSVERPAAAVGISTVPEGEDPFCREGGEAVGAQPFDVERAEIAEIVEQILDLA